MAAVKAGADRQDAHEAIRLASRRASEAIHAGEPNPLVELLRAEPAFAAVAGQLDELLDRSVSTCAAQIAQAEVEVSIDVEAEVPLVADGDLMASALSNVVRNAVEAMQESDGARRCLALSVRRASLRCPDGELADRVVLSVADTGPGVAPETIERMFNPFFTTRRTGTGLGLAIVHRIVDAHGGHIRIQSKRHKGTVVVVELPIDDEE